MVNLPSCLGRKVNYIIIIIKKELNIIYYHFSITDLFIENFRCAYTKN